MSEKQSQFIEVDTISDDDYFPIFGNGVNRKINSKNLLDEIKSDVFSPFIYPTISSLKQANLEADQDNPVYVRVEETGYVLYKITTEEALANDISLDNGATATFQVEGGSEVKSINDIATIKPALNGQTILTNEYIENTDIGSTEFYAVSGPQTVDDIDVFISGASNKFWKRKRTRILNVWDFGASPGGLIDSTSAFLRAQDYSIKYGGCAIHIPEGTYLISGDGISTEPSNSYYRMEDYATYWFGSGTGTILTRNESSASDIIDINDPSDFHNAIFNVHSGNNVFENFRIENTKSGIYIGQIDGEVDTCHGSMNRFSKIWISNSGLGLHMRSGIGNYYNAFNDIHIWQCQIGEYIAKHPSSLISAANNNRNHFKHFRNARCHVGLWLVDGDTNQFIGQHNEGNSLTPTNNRYAVPAGLPYGLTGGIGQLVDTNGINNQFVACMQEGCEVELVNAGERNSYSGLYRDETSGKVRLVAIPSCYQTRTMSITNQGKTYAFNNPQSDILAGKSAGFLHNEQQVRSNIGFRLDLTTTDYCLVKYGFDLGAVASGASVPFTIWAENSDEASSSANFDVTVTGNSQTNSMAHTTTFRVAALRNSSRVLTRYYIYNVEQARATGANVGDLTEPFTPALSISGNNLVVTLTAPARTFESVNVFVTRNYSKA